MKRTITLLISLVLFACSSEVIKPQDRGFVQVNGEDLKPNRLPIQLDNRSDVSSLRVAEAIAFWRTCNNILFSMEECPSGMLGCYTLRRSEETNFIPSNIESRIVFGYITLDENLEDEEELLLELKQMIGRSLGLEYDTIDNSIMSIPPYNSITDEDCNRIAELW